MTNPVLDGNIVTGPISQPTERALHLMEIELSELRRCLIIADRYSNLSSKKAGATMPPIVQQWIEYRIGQLIAQQVALLKGLTPPTIVT